MEIVKGSKEYNEYIATNIAPDRTVEDYILTIEEDVLVDMLDSGELMTYNDDYVRQNMEENGYTLVIPEN